MIISAPSARGAEPDNAAIFVPPGLNPGDVYHIAFVTRGTHDALSVDIADYNQFVRYEAVLPGALTEKFGIEWFAIGSTAEVDAQDNAVISAPVYLLDGTRLSPLVPVFNHWYPVLPFNRDQFGTLYEGFVWTGSMDGVANAVLTESNSSPSSGNLPAISSAAVAIKLMQPGKIGDGVFLVQIHIR